MSILFAAAFAAVGSYPVMAVDYPFKFIQEQNIDRNQVGHVSINIDANGKGVLEDFWSNGKKIAGNTFYAIVALVDKDRNVLWSDKEVKGLDGSWFGHAREGRVVKKFALDKEQMDAFDHVEFRLGVTDCGMIVTDFKCCNNGIEVTLGTKRCNVPNAPRAIPPFKLQRY